MLTLLLDYLFLHSFDMGFNIDSSFRNNATTFLSSINSGFPNKQLISFIKTKWASSAIRTGRSFLNANLVYVISLLAIPLAN